MKKLISSLESVNSYNVAKVNYSHPLFGANLKTLMTLYRRSGGLKPSHKGLFFLFILSALARWPFTRIEALYVFLKRKKKAKQDPIFILGHWRSGTTHLYNVLSTADRYGYVSPFATALPWDILVIGRLFAPLLKKGLPNSRFIDNVKVDAQSPQEDEIALANMSHISYYHAIYFPENFEHYFNQGVFFDGLDADQKDKWEKTLKYLYLKLTLDQDGRRLLIKNPVYTARPAHLLGIFPAAKLIHIHRHPYRVFVSMRNFYEKLFPELALQRYDHIDIDMIVFRTYRRMMMILKEQTRNLPNNQYTEMRFDDFQTDPIGELRKVYTQLDLGDFEEDSPAFTAYLDTVKNYQKNTFELPEDLKARIDANWGDLYADWGYEAHA